MNPLVVGRLPLFLVSLFFGGMLMQPCGKNVEKLNAQKVKTPESNRFITLESIAELKGSIEKEGQLHPILAYPDPDDPGCYVAADGNRRTLVCRILGIPVNAIVLDHAPTEEELIRFRFASNHHRKNASSEDIVRDALRLMELTGMNQGQAADALGISAGHLAKLIKKVRNAIPEVMEAERSGQIVPDVARLISQLPDDEQMEVLTQAVEKQLTRDAVQGIVARKKGSKPKKKPIKIKIGPVQIVLTSDCPDAIYEASKKLHDAAKKYRGGDFPFDGFMSL